MGYSPYYDKTQEKCCDKNVEFIMTNILLGSDLYVSLFSKEERFNKEEGKITVFIIWQGTLEIKSSTLIGSILDEILPLGSQVSFLFKTGKLTKQPWPQCHIINLSTILACLSPLVNIGP